MEQKTIFIIGWADLINTVGGAMTVFNNLSNFLADNGYNVKSICYNPENIKDRPKALNEKVEYVNLYCLNQTSYAAAMNSYLESYSTDLLIFFFPIFYINAKLSEKFNKIPRILMLHSRPDWYFQDKKILEQLKNAWTENSIAQILFSSFYPLVPDFMKKVVCIPNYTQKPVSTVINSECRKRIVYFSKVDPYKGLQFLLKAMCLVSKQHPDWSLDIYGQSVPADYASNLKRVAKRLNLDKQVKFKGISHHAEETLLNYDFGVFPSFFEGFGLGLCEMLSVGLPVVGLQGASGVNELIIDGYNGYLTQDRPEEYAEKIIELIENAELRQKMSANAIQSVAQYTEENVNNQWLRLIKGILNDNFKSMPIKTSAIKYPLFSIQKISQSHTWLDFVHKKYIKLFNFIPFLLKISFNGRTDYKVFGIPVFKICRTSSHAKYYFLNILLLKVTKK